MRLMLQTKNGTNLQRKLWKEFRFGKVARKKFVFNFFSLCLFRLMIQRERKDATNIFCGFVCFFFLKLF
jgi:hypothetical protein